MDADVKHHLTLGRDFYRAGEYDRARPHLEAVRAACDEFADVHNMLGFIEYDRGNPRRAQAEFERALALNPGYTEAALHLAIIYNEIGRYDDARDVYSRAHGERGGEGLDELNAFVRGKIANMHADLGDAYVAIGLTDHATSEYRRALRVCPTFVDIRTKLATALRDQGKFDEALDEFIAVCEANPEFRDARVQLGVTYWRSGRIQEARQTWNQILAEDPDHRRARVYLRMTAPETDPPAAPTARADPSLAGAGSEDVE